MGGRCHEHLICWQLSAEFRDQVNASDLPDDVKVRLQGYVSGCYGTLTSFNVLFADEDDQFKGAAAD